MSRREIEAALIRIEKEYVTIPWLMRGLLSRNRYKRHMYQWFLKVSMQMSVSLARELVFPSQGPIVPLLKPEWYDD